jgi:hypothetical protein
MQQIARGTDLTFEEMRALRHIVARSFVSRSTVTQVQRDRLASLGLINCAMGGMMPTPAGKIAARI